MLPTNQGRQPSVMSHNFSTVPRADIQRSRFNRSHGFKSTFNSGYLIPIFVDEALPGDTFSLNMSTFCRLATPIVPIMDNMYLDSFFFFVPNRLLWTNWERFNGAQDDPDDTTDFLVPQVPAPDSTGFAVGTLFDYFGIPTGIDGFSVNAFHSRAYNLIWNAWFRDQNIQDSVVVDLDNGPDDPTDYVLLRRGKRHDYFTSCLPWPQKGPDVTLPLGTSAPVLGIGKVNMTYLTGPVTNYESNGATRDYAGYQLVNTASPTTGESWRVEEDPNNAGYPHIFADLSDATASTINALREAFQLQKLYERDARGGTRYTEIVQAHFGVTSPDARLQRPEFLGGGSQQISITPIPQTSETTETGTPQGNLAAYGVSSGSGHGFSKSFTEHGVVIGLVSVRADLNYQQGLNRMWSRRTRWDYYWPALAHIGEQAVLNKEIYIQGTGVGDPGEQDDDAFGYQERYAEYRYKPSLITGQFRSTYATPLDVWHLAQEFEALPALTDPAFIEDNPPVERVIAIEDETYPQFLFDAYFNLVCARPMPVNSVPGLIDHF